MSETLSVLAIDDPEGFDMLVARLRKLGVTRLGDLELGTVPHEHATREPRTTDPRDPREKIHATMFAATSVRPPLPETAPTGDRPRAIVQRRARDEGGRHGEGTST